MRRDEHEYLSRLQLLPAGYGVVNAPRTIVLVEVGRMGPRRRWPGTYDDTHPLQSMPEIVVAAIGDEYAIRPEDFPWSTEMRGWRGCGPRFAVLLDGVK